MIVKNESHIIAGTLAHLLEHFKFSYWVIDDTGSTDGTQDIIRNFFAERGISGELFETPWEDFGHNRTEAFKHAYGKSDYVLVWDADDSIEGDFALPTSLTADYYTFIFGNASGSRYSRALLFNNRKRWKYVGVLHEYPACCESHGPSAHIVGNYYFISGRTGARSQDPNKYLRDAEVLERGLLKEPNNDRYAFYCANSYKDAGRPDKAIEFYKKTLTMNGWAEEKYLSAMRIYDLSACEEHLFYLVEANKHSPDRAEAIMRLVRHYCNKGMNRAALAYYTLIQDFYENRYHQDSDVSKKLFAEQIDYDFYMPYFVIISALHERRYETAYKMFDMIFHRKCMSVGAWWIKNLFHNIGLLVEHMTPNLRFLFNMLEYRDSLGYVLEPPQVKNIAAIIDRHRPLLTAPIVPPASLRCVERPRIMFTITTCKRIDLFEKTMNSILRTWKDFDKIEYFLCVDDNSSAHDRSRMRELYPFLNFRMKTPAEKGHRASMNIIWEHLNRLRPTFWIHMEDDFLFFREENYVLRSIATLQRHKAAGIQQILFNRNYAELYDWGTNGGEPTGEKGVIVHVQSDTIPGRNCGYWPHYSFRPSMVSVAAILALGNYDSPNTFFEMDYAKRWTAAGYKSAFYDTIMCLHIGKLTTDRSGQNAYTLNGESQFGGGGGGAAPAVPSGSKTLVVNLRRRPDRRAAMEELFRARDVSDYEYFEAVDGKELTATDEIITLFAGNDFGSRRGFFGCAMSHYRIWQQLVADPSCGYYVVLEDDITLYDEYSARLQEARTYFVDNEIDIMMLGFTQADQEARFRPSTAASRFATLNRSQYIGGTFGYIISKRGAAAYLTFIRENGIRHGIDYLLKLLPDSVRIVATQPHIVYSEWARSPSSNVDSDIQYNGDRIDLFEQWEFHPRVDQIGDDIRFAGRLSKELLLREAVRTEGCIAFNTLGFLKRRAATPLSPSRWFGEQDGVYVRRGALVTSRKKRVQLLCGWGPSERLAEDFRVYTKEGDNCWGDVEFTASSDNIDYYVIFNKPQAHHVYDPAKTIVLQLEPWGHATHQTWGVKSWGEWSEPDPARFLRVLGVKTHWTPAFWQLQMPWKELTKDYVGPKQDTVSCILSEKLFDPGHHHRLAILRALERTQPDISLNIFGRENYHGLASYRGTVSEDKENYIRPYKYYVMLENNSEEFYVTEKLWDPILSEALCFYWGSPRIAEHVDPRAYVVLDVSDYEAAAAQIAAAVKANLWEERLPYIRAAKQRILNELSLAPVLAKIVEESQ
jgi:GR25 family glycosyltransferase involved in LPS biosynthesis/glycosyltransferase involved in cell wall biosynthesis